MPTLLKEKYSKTYIQTLALTLQKAHPSFNPTTFQKRVFSSQWENLELKARMHHICQEIHTGLNLDYPEAISVLDIIAPEFNGFEAMFIPHYVHSFGLNDWKVSMKALASFTRYSSSEFAVRPFIELNQNKMMKQMEHWSRDSNEHIRRLASEGCRPRLPWATPLKEFKLEPRPIIPILDNLKYDDSLYVRRSVANNINDISKDNPSLVIDMIRLWKAEKPQQDDQNSEEEQARLNQQHLKQEWILKHGARTLLKKGQPIALSLFDYPRPKNISVQHLTCQPHVKIGEKLKFSFTLKNDEKNAKSKNKSLGKIRIEYRIDFMKANGNSRKKIFKLCEGDYQENQLKLNKQQSFQQFSTRRLF